MYRSTVWLSFECRSMKVLTVPFVHEYASVASFQAVDEVVFVHLTLLAYIRSDYLRAHSLL